MYRSSAFPVQRPLQNYMAGRLTDYQLLYTTLVSRLHEQSCISHTGYSFTVKWETKVRCDVKKRRRRSHYSRSDWMAPRNVDRFSRRPYLHSIRAAHNAARSLYGFSLSTNMFGAKFSFLLPPPPPPIRKHTLSVGDRETDWPVVSTCTARLHTKS
jgi:hypothetical protein